MNSAHTDAPKKKGVAGIEFIRPRGGYPIMRITGGSNKKRGKNRDWIRALSGLFAAEKISLTDLNKKHTTVTWMQVRIELLEKGRPLLAAAIQSITQRNVVSLHIDISAVTGERVVIFTLDGEPRCDAVEEG